MNQQKVNINEFFRRQTFNDNQIMLIKMSSIQYR